MAYTGKWLLIRQLTQREKPTQKSGASKFKILNCYGFYKINKHIFPYISKHARGPLKPPQLAIEMTVWPSKYKKRNFAQIIVSERTEEDCPESREPQLHPLPLNIFKETLSSSNKCCCIPRFWDSIILQDPFLLRTLTSFASSVFSSGELLYSSRRWLYSHAEYFLSMAIVIGNMKGLLKHLARGWEAS